MSTINHGTFAIYTPSIPGLPDAPMAPVAPAMPAPLGNDATPEQQAEHAAATMAYQSAMAVRGSQLAAHSRSMDAWRSACEPIKRLQALFDAKAIFARRADGADWYDLTREMPDGRNYAIAISGRVVSVAHDAQMFGIQDGMTLLETTEPVEAGWSWDGATLSAPPQPTLSAVRGEYKAKIDADAERTRLKYITPGAGMQMTYREKLEQAEDVIAAGQAAADALTTEQATAQYPTLSASIGLEAPTLYACAVLVRDKYLQFAALSHEIERTRLTAKAAIDAATTAEAVAAAYSNITWTV